MRNVPTTTAGKQEEVIENTSCDAGGQAKGTPNNTVRPVCKDRSCEPRLILTLTCLLLLLASSLMAVKNVRNNAPSGDGKNEKTQAPQPQMSRRRLWLLRILSATLVPLVVLGGLEAGLRLFGFGHNTRFFVRARISGQDYWVGNDRFAYRFFPPALARTPMPLRLAVKKPANTFRIFLFGESAAQGDPNPAFGAGRYLQTLLRERYPGTDFEVICTAMPAINSHAILPIARECAHANGDLWIIYMGNNEMIGPFGASTVFGTHVPGVVFVRAILAVRATRLGQLLDNLISKAEKWAGRSEVPKVWTGLEMFKDRPLRYDDPNRLRAYENFRKNLSDILRAGRAAGVPVILSTVASNLKDCPPFGSSHAATLPESQKLEWEALLRQGDTLETAGNYEEASRLFARAAALDSESAELQFRLAQCHLALTNAVLALREFESARDHDTLAFRADTRINQIITDAASTRAGEGVYLLDTVRMLEQHASGDIPGHGLFNDHVHFNFAGNYLLGRAFAEAAAKLLPELVPAHAKVEWPSADVCDRRLAVTPWDRYAVWMQNFSRVSQPPFTDQLNSALRAKFYLSALDNLRLQMTDAAREQGLALYKETLASAPDDYLLHDNFAEFLSNTSDLSGAVREERHVSELLPESPLPAFKTGVYLVRQGDISGAEQSFARALKLRRDYPPAWNELGVIRANQQKTAEAAACFTRVLRFDPGFVDTYVNWGFMEQVERNLDQAFSRYKQAADLLPAGPPAYFYRGVLAARNHQRDDALNYLNAAASMKPSFWQALYLLGMELASAGRMDEAEARLSQATIFRPDFPRGHLNYGAILAQRGKLDQALKEFEVAVRLDPADKIARTNLQRAQADLQARALRKR